MSFSSTKNLPAPSQKPFNVDEERTSTNEQARPVPYFAGITRLGVTFISEAFNVKSKKLQMKLGKKKETVGYNYFASFAALVAHGPIDRLDAIWMDDELVWQGPLIRSGDYASLTIAGRGNIRFYWGTETQTQDSILATSGMVHPAYRGQAYLVCDQLFFGRDRTNAPNIEVQVGRWPNAPWLPTPNSIQDDVNPVIALWDFWTNPRCGLGLPESRLDMDSLAAVGEQLDAEGIGVSPVINRAMNFRQFLVELCECVDAYPTYDPQGRLGLALVRNPEEVAVAIGPADLADAPTLNPQGWHDTFNETFIRFTDRDHRFEESSVAYRDRGNFQVTQTVLSQTLSRLWITRQSVAQKVANAAGRAAAKPMLSGSMRVRKSSGTNLTVGGTFALYFPQSGVNGVLCRVERLTLPAPGQGEVAVSFVEGTGFFNAAHYAAEADTPQTETVYQVQELAYEKLAEAPLGLNETSTPFIVFLAARGDVVSNGFNLWKQRTDLSYRDVGAFDSFGQRAHLFSEYPTLLIDDYLGLEIQFDSLDDELDEVSFTEAQENRLLVFAGDEIMSVWGAQLIAAGRYRLWTIRARYDTKRQTHAVDAEVWVALRDDLAMRLDVLDPPEKTFKLQPFLLQNEFDLAEVDPVSITLQKRACRPLAPLNLRVAGDGYNPNYGTGTDIVADWDKSWYRSSEDPVTKILNPEIDQTVLELWTMGGVLAGTFKFGGGTGPRTITNAQLVTALGTWKQMLPAALTVDPSSGTIPTGYMILNVTQGTLKRHAGSYDWQSVVGATSGKIGFWGATPVTQPAGPDQAAVTLGNTDGEIGGLTVSDPPTQAEAQALRDKCEELADDLRALSALVHALRGALVAVGVIKWGVAIRTTASSYMTIPWARFQPRVGSQTLPFSSCFYSRLMWCIGSGDCACPHPMLPARWKRSGQTFSSCLPSWCG